MTHPYRHVVCVRVAVMEVEDYDSDGDGDGAHHHDHAEVDSCTEQTTLSRYAW